MSWEIGKSEIRMIINSTGLGIWNFMAEPTSVRSRKTIMKSFECCWQLLRHFKARVTTGKKTSGVESIAFYLKMLSMQRKSYTIYNIIIIFQPTCMLITISPSHSVLHLKTNLSQTLVAGETMIDISYHQVQVCPQKATKCPSWR